MNRLQEIFNRQRNLMEKYHHIEVANGLMQTEDCPVDLDSMQGQARLRDFAWRITEEIAEAINSKDHIDDYKEELVDVLHFLTEFTILAGRDFDSVSTFDPDEGSDHLQLLFDDGMTGAVGKNMEELITEFIENLGMTINKLKNKVWKQSLRPTDVFAFYDGLEKVWLIFMAIMGVSGMEPDDIYMGYLDKANINKKRQEGGY